MTLKETTHSIAGAAKILGISRELCRQAVEKKQIHAIRMGDRYLIPDATLQQILADAAGNGVALPITAQRHPAG